MARSPFRLEPELLEFGFDGFGPDFVAFFVKVEEVGHDLLALQLEAGGPVDLAADGEDLAGEEPPHEPDGVGALVVAGDGHVDVLGGRVHVGEGDDRDVGVGALGDGLVISAGIGYQQQTGLAEGGLDLVSKCT